MDGFIVKRLIDAVSGGDIFITCTGQIHVIRKEHIIKMKSGSILANAGHFDIEIDTKYLKSNCDDRYLVRRYLECFRIRGKRVYLLSSGRVVNLVGSEGNAPEVMAMSFANQLLSIIYIWRNHRNMKRAVHDVPMEIDQYVALTSLKSLGIKIDKLTDIQLKYSNSY
jgi:adenosylhomocysteinase